MKKKLFTAISATLISATLLASCSQASQKLQFSPNWAQNTLGNTGLIEGTETLAYEVSFEKDNFLNSEYFTVAYADKSANEAYGSYTTKLEPSAEDEGYKYTTTLTVDVTFAMANGETATFTDSVTTTTVFKSSALALQPIRSVKSVKSHTPRNIAATKLEEAYVNYDYTVQIDYDDLCENGKIIYTDNAGTLITAESYPAQKEQDFTLNTEKYTYLDNEQLLFAVRGLSSTVLSTERTVTTYDVSTSAQQQVKIKPSTGTSDKFSFNLNGTPLPADTVIEYIPLTLTLNTVNEGAPISAWYAKTTDSANNVYRNVLLKMVTSVTYNIGALTYTLKDAVFAK